MSLDNQIYLNNNFLLKKYLHENPKYYKYLNRDPSFINELNNLMKKDYKIDVANRINKFKEKIELVNTFIDILN